MAWNIFMGEKMSFVLRVTKLGSSFYFHVPMQLANKEKLKHGDLFELEIDTIPPTYTIRKIGNNSN